MRPIYRLVLVALLAFMFRTPLLRLHQTASHFTPSSGIIRRSFFSNSSVVLQQQNASDDTMAERPSGLIAKSGLELLTFGTPNGEDLRAVVCDVVFRSD